MRVLRFKASARASRSPSAPLRSSKAGPAAGPHPAAVAAVAALVFVLGHLTGCKLLPGSGADVAGVNAPDYMRVTTRPAANSHPCYADGSAGLVPGASLAAGKPVDVDVANLKSVRATTASGEYAARYYWPVKPSVGGAPCYVAQDSLQADFMFQLCMRNARKGLETASTCEANYGPRASSL